MPLIYYSFQNSFGEKYCLLFGFSAYFPGSIQLVIMLSETPAAQQEEKYIEE